MNAETAIRRAQVYRFLADALHYPSDDWTQDAPLVANILCELNVLVPAVGQWTLDVERLQAEHRRAFGLSGSLCYETEYGLPHEYRLSQELADIAGFYRAFGFENGGTVRERPDHVGAELEFMYALALKEAYALTSHRREQAETCADAQRKFLQDHLALWIGLFAESLAQNATEGPYVALARFAAAFVKADAERLGVTPEQRNPLALLPTPLGPELSCDDCPVVMSDTC